MLELKNLSFNVQDESDQKEIIRDISLTIPDHKLIVITGPNGGGKSTLACLIAGVEKPTSGSVLFDGNDLAGLGQADHLRIRHFQDILHRNGKLPRHPV